MTIISLLQLPLDILIVIIQFLKISDIQNVMLCCKHLKDVILNQNVIWKHISKDKFVLNSRSNAYSWYNKLRISHNWCNGLYRDKVVIHHNVNYMPWLKLYNSEVIYLSVGSTLRCYDVAKKGTPKCTILWSVDVPIIKRYDIRTNDISRFIVKDNMIVCGNRDGCVAVYKLTDVRKPPLLQFHIEDCHESGFVEVSAVEKINNVIVTASSNCYYISFWHTIWENKNVTNIIDSKTDIPLPSTLGCRSIAVNNFENKLALGLNGNSKPLLLDVTTSKVVMSEETINAKQVIKDIQWHSENSIVFVTHSGKLGLMDTRTGTLVYETRDPFQSSLYCVKTDCDRSVIVGSSEYSRCALFDLRSTQHIQMYFTQKKSSPIYSLDFDTTRLVAAADRGVAILNFNVNAANTSPRDYSHTFEIVSR